MIEPRPCVDCKTIIQPYREWHLRCRPCAKKRKAHTNKTWLNENTDRARIYRKRQREAQRIYQMQRYDMFQRHHSKIVGRPDFVAFVKNKIQNRRGDSINIKSLVRLALKKLEITVDNTVEYEKCYTAVVNIVRSLGGKEVGRNARDSLIFQWS